MIAHWQALILAASRGRNDPMAAHYGTLHKCVIPIGGLPMIARVVDALQASRLINSILVSAESAESYDGALGARSGSVVHVQSQSSAPASALYAISKTGHLPLLITTGDHALLTPAMVNCICSESEALQADFTVGLATAETILARYPATKRTFFKFGTQRVSGCNLFTVHTERGKKALERWQHMEQNRKSPWKLVFSFGVWPLAKFALGRLSLEQAFATASKQLGIKIAPVLLPFAEAAIDVDKPSDKELAESIIAARRA